ncbi:MAG: succinate dehydrogenase cytochrome b subunit [Flavobacteriia bacterium]|nr:succinate dehydrogenase cytochrome b subunit [Flavobacteriia bacterium]
MSKSVLLKSSIAKKYWMALTGLFLCLFLVGHLLGNLQLFAGGEEGRRAFNEYAYFMQHNPLIKVMSYVTYLSILFHAIDGIMLAVQNKKARPVQYAVNNAKSNSSGFARQMALLGSIIFIFIITHMVNFWAKMHFDGKMPMHTINKELEIQGQDPMTGQPTTQKIPVTYALTTKGDYKEVSFINPMTKVSENAVDIKNHTELYDKNSKLKIGEGYKDLHSVVLAFFGKKNDGNYPINDMGKAAAILYLVAMIVLSFHLMHGFSSAFQSLGIRHKRYTPAIEMFGKIFSIVVPALFAIIPLYICFG